MARRDSIKLYFIKDSKGLPALIRTEVRTDTGKTVLAVAKEKEEPGSFVWKIKKGKLRLFALALVRAARTTPQDGETPPPAIFLLRAERASSKSRKCAETQLYDLSTYKACAWLSSILSENRDWSGDAKPRFNRWFKFHHIRGKDSSGLPSVELNTESLRSEDIEIILDDQSVSPAMCDEIESVLAANIDASFPPYFVSKGHTTAGFMPSVGASFGNRERELTALTSLYSDLNCAAVEIVGESGFGKTALVRWWMRELFRDDRLREKLIFSWSFPRQSRSDSTRQSLSKFFRSLGRELKVELRDGLSPQEIANQLIEGMKAKSTFLFLDGVEALLNQLGDFAIGGEKMNAPEQPSETTFHYDSLLYFLQGILSPANSGFAFLVLTTREGVHHIVKVAEPRFQKLELQPYSGFAFTDEELEREARCLSPDPDDDYSEAFREELKSAKRRRTTRAVDGQLAESMAKFRDADVTARLRYLVRKKIDQFGTSPERCLVYVASCFDEEADWDAVMHVVSGAHAQRHVTKGKRERGAAEELTAQWKDLTERDWGDALENLEECDLVLPSGGGFVALHSSVQRCVYDDFRKNMPEVCADVHRRLCRYFADDPKIKEFPDTIEEMDPLFRACWHGCNAGDFQETFQTITYDRMCRRWQAYVLFQLCEYEESIQVLNLFTEDGETFPASDLHEDVRITIKHGIALCQRYLDQLNQAYRQERIAWKESHEKASHPQLGPIAANLLRLHHIFGDIGKEVTPVLLSLLRGALPNLVPAAMREEIPKSMIPQGIGYCTGIAALIQACRDNRKRAEAILFAGRGLCKVAGFTVRHLMPGMGVVHHALALLELGDWQTVLDGDKAKQFDSPLARYNQTGAISYVRGRALAMSSASPGVQEKALIEIERCAWQSKGNYRWWRAASLLEIGKIKMKLARMSEARAAFAEAIGIATGRNTHFKLIEVDALLGLAELDTILRNSEDARAGAAKALSRLEKCGYEARRVAAERFLKV